MNMHNVMLFLVFFVLCLLLAASAAVGASKAENRLAVREAEIDGHYQKLAQADPGNARIYYDWGRALDELAITATRNIKLGGDSSTKILEKACVRYKAALELDPQNQGYALILAYDMSAFFR